MIKIKDDLQKQKRIRKHELGDFYYCSVMSHLKIIAPLIKACKNYHKNKNKDFMQSEKSINLIKTF